MVAIDQVQCLAMETVVRQYENMLAQRELVLFVLSDLLRNLVLLYRQVWVTFRIIFRSAAIRQNLAVCVRICSDFSSTGWSLFDQVSAWKANVAVGVGEKVGIVLC
jgi:hypothetical protein